MGFFGLKKKKVMPGVPRDDLKTVSYYLGFFNKIKGAAVIHSSADFSNF